MTPKRKIKDIESENKEADLSVPEGVSIDDPVRMYLKEIGESSFAYG